MTKQWADFEAIITGLYKHQNKPLREVQRIMEEQYNFKASCVTPVFPCQFHILLDRLVLSFLKLLGRNDEYCVKLGSSEANIKVLPTEHGHIDPASTDGGSTSIRAANAAA